MYLSPWLYYLSRYRNDREILAIYDFSICREFFTGHLILDRDDLSHSLRSLSFLTLLSQVSNPSLLPKTKSGASNQIYTIYVFMLDPGARGLLL